MFLRRLFKWLGIVAAVLVLAALIVVWPVLGVNPFEGDVDHLWSLVSNEAHFFLRFPAARTLDQPFVEQLAQEEGLEFLADARRELTELTRTVAAEVNPQVPLGLVEVDVERDFVGREMAIAGTIRDYRHPKLENFLLATRVAGYARFVSALKRGFVRNAVQGAQIDVVKGLYFRVKIDAATVAQLRPYRGVRVAPQREDVLFVGRIKDVLLISDNDLWIEDALLKGRKVLSADPYFESEFIRRTAGGDRVELFVRQELSRGLLGQHGRRGGEGILSAVTAIMPQRVTGDLTVELDPSEPTELAAEISGVPPSGGFAQLAPYLQRIYDSPAGNLRADFSATGIGALVPRQNTVGAIVFHTAAADFIDFVVDLIPPDEHQLFDDGVRSTSKSRYRDLRQLLQQLGKGLSDTHLLVIHRPTAFDAVDYTLFEDLTFPPSPEAQFSFTFVSRVQDGASPQTLANTFETHLQYLGMRSLGKHKSGAFTMAQLDPPSQDLKLLAPAFGAVEKPDRYFVFSTSLEGAEAVFAAAANPGAGLVSDDSMQRAVQKLPPEGTLGVILSGGMLHRGLLDRVRIFAAQRMDMPGYMRGWVASFGGTPTDAESNAEKERYKAEQYPRLKELYESQLAPLRRIQAVALGAHFGTGAQKKIRARATITLTPAE